MAERETFTLFLFAMHYGPIIILYRDLVPCFVIARGGMKKLRCTIRFYVLGWKAVNTKFGSLRREPHSHFIFSTTPCIWIRFSSWCSDKIPVPYGAGGWLGGEIMDQYPILSGGPLFGGRTTTALQLIFQYFLGREMVLLLTFMIFIPVMKVLLFQVVISMRTAILILPWFQRVPIHWLFIRVMVRGFFSNNN